MKSSKRAVHQDMDDWIADITGMQNITHAMESRLLECREAGKGNWHRMGSVDPLTNKENTIERFTADAKKALNEGRSVDAANYCMMIYNLENHVITGERK